MAPVAGENLMSPAIPRIESPVMLKTSAVPPAPTRQPNVVTRTGRTVKPVSKLTMNYFGFDYWTWKINMDSCVFTWY